MSNSRIRTTAPTRAITSNLTSRSSASIPPASQLYEPLVKSVLRHRLLYSIFPYSAVFSWVQISIWTTWSNGGIKTLGISGVVLNLFMPSTLALAVLNWVGSALPVIVLRKVYLTPTRTLAPSPAKTLYAAFAKKSTFRALSLYMLSSILTCAAYLIIVYTGNTNVIGDPRLSLFVKSKKHPYYLNSRLLFVILSQIMVACEFLLRNILLDRFVFRWPASATSTIRKWPFSVQGIAQVAFASLAIAIFSMFMSITSFGLIRISLPWVFKLPLTSRILRPFLAHFLRGSWTLLLPFQHTSLLVRTFFLGLTTLATWEFSESLFDAFIPQPIITTQRSTDPFLILISGISSTDRVFQYAAFAELEKLAKDDSPAASARRSTLFSDTKYTPTLWSRLVRDSLLQLGRDYQLFLARGKPPLPTPTPALPPPPPPPSRDLPFPSTPTSLIKTSIYKNPRQSPIHKVIDSLASDGSIPLAVDSAIHVPEIFRSVESVVQPGVKKAVDEVKKVGEVKTWVEKARATVGEVGMEVMVRYTPVQVQHVAVSFGDWWRRERLSKVVEGCLPTREIDVLIIEVLSHLTCASLTEDSYGVVQRDIPRILEALLSFLSAIEAYQVEISAMYIPPPPDQQLPLNELEEKETLRVEVEKAGAVLGLIGDALKEGVARIVRTFGDKLHAFKFPPRTARKLQGFLDYH